MRALERVAQMTGREPEETGGGVRVITRPSPTRTRYVLEVVEVDAEHVSVAARHLDADGVHVARRPCRCPSFRAASPAPTGWQRCAAIGQMRTLGGDRWAEAHVALDEIKAFELTGAEAAVLIRRVADHQRHSLDSSA